MLYEAETALSPMPSVMSGLVTDLYGRESVCRTMFDMPLLGIMFCGVILHRRGVEVETSAKVALDTDISLSILNAE
jgi:hypothetical protein